MSRLTKGYAIAIAGIAFWSTSGIFISIIISRFGLPALVLAFWRNFFVTFSLAPLLFLFRRPLMSIKRSQLGFFLVFGLLLALLNSDWALSVQFNGAAVATVLGYSSAGFTAVLAWLLFEESLGLPKILAVFLSISGCVMVSNALNPEVWKLNPLGATSGLLLGLILTGYNLISKEAARRDIHPWTALLYSFGFGAMFILLFNFVPGLPGTAGNIKTLLPVMPIQGWLLLLALALLPTLMGFGLYLTSMNYLPVSTVNLLATLDPALTAVQAYILLGERMTGIQIVGAVIILFAVVMVQFGKEERAVHMAHPSVEASSDAI